MVMAHTQVDFARAEFDRIFIEDDELTWRCRERAKSFWPTESAALVRDEIIACLCEKTPLSLVRVGNGEGNAVSMTKETLHPLQVSAFYSEFIGQNGIPIPREAA